MMHRGELIESILQNGDIEQPRGEREDSCPVKAIFVLAFIVTDNIRIEISEVWGHRFANNGRRSQPEAAVNSNIDIVRARLKSTDFYHCRNRSYHLLFTPEQFSQIRWNSPWWNPFLRTPVTRLRASQRFPAFRPWVHALRVRGNPSFILRVYTRENEIPFHRFAFEIKRNV